MRIRFPFLIAFIILLFASSSIGLLPHSALPSTPSRIQPYIPAQSDKVLHFFMFLALTLTFYFILDTTRRRVLHITLFVCTLLLGLGSEIVQGLLPNGRDWDPWDVLANVLGSLAAVGLAGAYHRRSAERRRKARYSSLNGGDEDDLELGAVVEGEQESGVVPVASATIPERGDSLMPLPKTTVEEEIDNWDENAEDEDAWSEDGEHKAKETPATSSRGSNEETNLGVGARVEKVAVD